MKNDVANTKNELNTRTASLLCGLVFIALGLFVWRAWGAQKGATFIVYGLLMVVVGNWSFVQRNPGTAVAVILCLVGIGATVYVAEHSTQKIDASLEKLESQINTTVKETTENAVQEIRTAFYPNEFELQVQRKNQWFKPSEGQIIEIRLEDNVVPLELTLRNNAESPARDVCVQVWVVKDHFKENQDEILDQFKQSNRFGNVLFGKTSPMQSKKGIVTVGIHFIANMIPPRTGLILERVNLHLKGNRGFLFIAVNVTNHFIFKFVVAGYAKLNSSGPTYGEKQEADLHRTQDQVLNLDTPELYVIW